MYLPEHFEETHVAAIRSLIEKHPLATVVASTREGLIANHLPVLFEGDDVLIGHVALANPMHQLIEPQDEVLVVFQGSDGYISPNWYPSKQDHHRHVPTWNYQVVHVHGKMDFQSDARTKGAVVGKLTREFEGRVNGSRGWRMADAPSDYLAEMLDNIIAFRISIERIEAKSKLSQNRSAPDFENVVDELEGRGETVLAAQMRRFQL
ncbi:MAG: FMN-binding negative transcriptional regulator [Alphaproteobacteria bacterium]|nr:MAG: FMN-binding negative transcriptional regulator [Alphaproteobacteria bacterium]